MIRLVNMLVEAFNPKTGKPGMPKAAPTKKIITDLFKLGKTEEQIYKAIYKAMPEWKDWNEYYIRQDGYNNLEGYVAEVFSELKEKFPEVKRSFDQIDLANAFRYFKVPENPSPQKMKELVDYLQKEFLVPANVEDKIMLGLKTYYRKN